MSVVKPGGRTFQVVSRSPRSVLPLISCCEVVALFVLISQNPDIFGSLLLDGVLGGGGEAVANSASQSQGQTSNNSNDVLSLLFSPSPSSTRPVSSHQLPGNQDPRRDSGTGDAVDFAGLFDAAPGGRYGAGGGGGGGALRLDADGKLVMSAEALAEEEDVTTDRPVCT